MKKLEGSCSECGSLNGAEHAKHCSKYPIFPVLKDDYKHPWIDELMEVEEIPNLNIANTKPFSPVESLEGTKDSQSFDTTAYDFPRKQLAPKDKTSKPDWSIFPFSEAEEVLKAFAFGVTKYGAPFTYRQGSGVPETDLLSATFRHLISIQNGEQTALDSQCYHWAHIACNALMAISTLSKQKEKK